MHRSYLLQVTPDSFQPSSLAALSFQRATPEAWDRCKSLWLGVGHGFWTARTRWTGARWYRHLSEPVVSFWIARERGHDVGFFELITQQRGVKLEGFGLLLPMRGRGLGAALLTAATRKAFRSGASRVWLHTATDDHPSALPNYLARGYSIYREQELKHPMLPKDERNTVSAHSAA